MLHIVFLFQTVPKCWYQKKAHYFFIFYSFFLLFMLNLQMKIDCLEDINEKYD